MTTPLPRLLRRAATDEYLPPPPQSVERQARHRARAAVRARAQEHRRSPVAYAATRTATAAALRALDAAAGGGFFDVPEDAERAPDVAAEVFDDPDGPPVVDVQTHLVDPRRFGGPAAAGLEWFLRTADPDRWSAGIDPALLGPATWADRVFGESETALAVITLPPGADDGRVVDNEDVARCREIVDAEAGPDRVLTHAIVHPNLAGEIEAMPDWAGRCRPAGWKVYPLHGPHPGGDPAGGWELTDEVGRRFLAAVGDSGVRRVAVHKGISGAVADVAPGGASPRDVGPAAAAHPDIDFLVYHSGYEPNLDEGPYRPRDSRGVDELIRGCATHEVGPGANVHAELGSTWHLVLRRPEQAAHVIGKLLAHFGPERLLWGTDSVWYGSPQPLIDAFRAFTIPEWMQERHGYPALTTETKRRILSANAQRVYRAEARRRDDRWVQRAVTRLRAAYPD